MFKKFNEFKKKPVTWGDYLKLCGWSLIGSGVITIASAIYFKLDDIRWEKELKNRERELFADLEEDQKDEAD